MNWFENKTTQLIGLVSIVGTLAGFGYTGATYVNRIENLESFTNDYMAATDQLADDVAEIDKRIVALEEQIGSIEIPDTTELKTSIAGINASIDSMYDDIQSLKNKNNSQTCNSNCYCSPISKRIFSHFYTNGNY